MIKANPDLFKYVSFPVMDTEADFIRQFYNKNISASPKYCLYGTFNKVTAPRKENTYSNYTSIIALSTTNLVNAVTEISVIIFLVF